MAYNDLWAAELRRLSVRCAGRDSETDDLDIVLLRCGLNFCMGLYAKLRSMDDALDTSSLASRRRWKALKVAGAFVFFSILSYRYFRSPTRVESGDHLPSILPIRPESQVVLHYDRGQVHANFEGFSTSRAEDTYWTCAQKYIQGSTTIVERKVLWTKPVAVEAYDRQLLSSSPPVNFSVTEQKRCIGYANIPRFVHSKPSSVKAEQIFFGLASDKARLAIEHSVPANWLYNSSTNLYISLPNSDASDAEAVLLNYFKGLGLRSTHPIRDPLEDEQTLRYARLSASMYELTRKKDMTHIKWFVHLDDDTFITSIDDYSHMLSKYDHTQPVYVGGHSESSSAHWRDGRGAWGGASIAVSRALAEQLSKNWEECAKRMDHTIFGDHKLDAAVAFLQGRSRQNPVIQLEQSLHQLDITGDLNGLIRAGSERWLTLHHFSWHNLFPGNIDKWAQFSRLALASRYLSSQNLYRNILLDYTLETHEDGTTTGMATVLTNGYAITEYFVPLARQDFELAELTWNEENGDHSSALGPYREKLQEGRDKKTYYVIEIKSRQADPSGQAGSSWLYRYDGGEEAGIQDIVVEWME